MNTEDITNYPLSWPVGWDRTEENKRQRSQFGRHSIVTSAPRVVQSARAPLPEHLQWWKKLSKDEKDHYIQYVREKRKAGFIT